MAFSEVYREYTTSNYHQVVNVSVILSLMYCIFQTFLDMWVDFVEP